MNLQCFALYFCIKIAHCCDLYADPLSLRQYFGNKCIRNTFSRKNFVTVVVVWSGIARISIHLLKKHTQLRISDFHLWLQKTAYYVTSHHNIWSIWHGKLMQQSMMYPIVIFCARHDSHDLMNAKRSCFLVEQKNLSTSLSKHRVKPK